MTQPEDTPPTLTPTLTLRGALEQLIAAIVDRNYGISLTGDPGDCTDGFAVCMVCGAAATDPDGELGHDADKSCGRASAALAALLGRGETAHPREGEPGDAETYAAPAPVDAEAAQRLDRWIVRHYGVPEHYTSINEIAAELARARAEEREACAKWHDDRAAIAPPSRGYINDASREETEFEHYKKSSWHSDSARAIRARASDAPSGAGEGSDNAG